MGSDIKKRMIEGAARLLARRGLQASSFAEILQLTGAPRGSVYHHFPDGKDELVAAAIERASEYLARALERKAGSSAEDIADHFLALWRGILIDSGFEAGCAILAVTVATDSPALLQQAGAIFRTWRARLAELLVQGGLSARQGKQFATTLIAAVEGGVVLSRAERSIEPFDTIARQMREQLRTMIAKK
jgi:TetR/AcrR family transcriptional repressor of lmrAB and yxaGH operons